MTPSTARPSNERDRTLVRRLFWFVLGLVLGAGIVGAFVAMALSALGIL